MKKFNTYLSLCTQVYDLSKPTPPEDAYAFYRSYVTDSQGLILEPMCGTGRFLLPLLEEGFNVHGFDASEHMLKALQLKAKNKNLSPNVWQGFVQNLSSGERYSLIFIPSGSFGLITDLDSVTSALKVFFEHLTDDGVLVFEAETNNTVPPLGVWRGSKWMQDDGKMILLSQCAFLGNNICSSIGKYELVNNNAVIQNEIEEYKVRIYKPDELTEILKSVGFSKVRTIKAFDREAKPSNNDESIVYECRI